MAIEPPYSLMEKLTSFLAMVLRGRCFQPEGRGLFPPQGNLISFVPGLPGALDELFGHLTPMNCWLNPVFQGQIRFVHPFDVGNPSPNYWKKTQFSQVSSQVLMVVFPFCMLDQEFFMFEYVTVCSSIYFFKYSLLKPCFWWINPNFECVFHPVYCFFLGESCVSPFEEIKKPPSVRFS